MKRPALVSALANEALELRRADAFCRVGIDGVDGSGKTFLADELAVALEAHGVPVARVSVDGFHNPRDIRYSKGRESPEGFVRDSYDYDRFIALVLRPFSTTEPACAAPTSPRILRGTSASYVPAFGSGPEPAANLVSGARRTRTRDCRR